MNNGDSSELLNSWKEIAAYLNRGVRTVQRWEIELGLPVRRPRGKNRSAVIAIRSELDAWIKACPVASTGKRMQHVVSSAPPPARPALRSLIVRSCQLRMDVSRRCDDLTTSLNKLLATLGSMMNQPDQPSNNSAQSIVKSVA